MIFGNVQPDNTFFGVITSLLLPFRYFAKEEDASLFLKKHETSVQSEGLCCECKAWLRRTEPSAAVDLEFS